MTTALVLATDELGVRGLPAARHRRGDHRLDEDRLVGHLGPDVLGPDWDLDEALRRLGDHPDEQIGVALVDQRNLAGTETSHKVESLFIRGVHPWTRVADVPGPHGPRGAGRGLDAAP